MHITMLLVPHKVRRVDSVNPQSAEILCKKHRNQMGYLNLKSSKMSSLALSDSLEYLSCYGSTAIRNIFNLTVRGDVRFCRLKLIPAL